MDLVCRDDLDEFASETDDEMELLAQDLEHRLLEEYSSNPDDDARGVGIMSLLSGTDSTIIIARLIEADFFKDDRVLTCVVDVTRVTANADGVFANLDIKVTTNDGLLKLGYAANVDGTLTGGVIP